MLPARGSQASATLSTHRQEPEQELQWMKSRFGACAD